MFAIKKIESKGSGVGLSFYAFFANKNDDPQLLMEAAQWWIMSHQLDHFEKATKSRDLWSLIIKLIASKAYCSQQPDHFHSP
jgi:hypothetical protein